MPAILTPALALRYLRELSTEVHGGAVLDAEGAPLAGAPALHAPAQQLAAVLAEAAAGAHAGPSGRVAELVVLDRGGAGVALAVRSLADPAGRTLVLVLGQQALPRPQAPSGGQALLAGRRLPAGGQALLALARFDAVAAVNDLAGVRDGGATASAAAAHAPPARPVALLLHGPSSAVQPLQPAESAMSAAISAASALCAASRGGVPTGEARMPGTKEKTEEE